MQLICGLIGHRPAPLQLGRAEGKRRSCVLCQQALARGADGGWQLADEARPQPAANNPLRSND
jgi:hypothetical protein